MSIAFQQPVSSTHQLAGYNTPYVSQQYNSHMGSDYNQSHLSSTQSVASAPSTYAYTAHPTETVSSDQPPVGYQPNTQEVRSSSTYSSSATPSSEYGIKPEYNINSTQRPPNFPQDYNVAPRNYPENRYPPASNGSSAGMNQSAPLPPLAHPMHRRPAHPESSEDTSITAASNPPYPPQHYPPYQQTPEMSQPYPQQPGGTPQQYHSGWPNPAYPAPPQFPYSHPAVSAGPPGAPLTAGRSPIVDKSRRKRNSNEQPPMAHANNFTFIPIPGATQHKRPRRRYEEIERMYKCGFQGCEKAYGTLNHLNAHVTMQGHGAKRTPEEFKEIRKEWKARKKEEEAQRKADEEAQRARQQADATANVDAPAPSVSSATYPSIPPRQLPPIGYQAQTVSTVPHYAQPSAITDTMQPYASANPIYSGQPFNGSPYNHSQGSQIFTPPRQQPAQASAGEVDADAEPDPDVPSGAYPQ